LIDITDAGVVIYEGSQTKKLSHTYSKLNDGNWHYVVVIWHKSTELNLILDGISQQRMTDVLKDQELNEK